ncbi:MAG TPA: hypothetical protein DEO32_05055 [Ruminococcaceae bacterium]|nr:hypothetical protein [Oscillospiraceae bacterium]
MAQSAHEARGRAAQDVLIKRAVTTAVYAVLGAVISRGAVLGNLAPFGVSFAAAVPKKYLLPSVLGAAFGYVLMIPTDSFRYIAAVAAVGAARWLLSEFDRIRKSRLFAPLTAFAAVLSTGLALLFGGMSQVNTFSTCVLEAALSGAAAYFLSSAVRLYDERKSLAACSAQESASLVLTVCVMLLSLSGIAIEGVSIGRIAAVTVILLCARYGGAAGGSVSGISTGAVFSLADLQSGYVCGGFAFGGLMSGLFAPLGKAGCAAAFTVSNALMSLAFGTHNVLASALIESVVGSAVFVLLPKELGSFISPVFTREESAGLSEALRKNIVMRLGFASKAITEVRRDVREVSEKLDEMYSPSFETVCENVACEVCSGCGMRMYCYEYDSGVTRDDFLRLEEPLRQNSRITDNDVEQSFVKMCCKKGEIADSMNTNYRNMLAAREASRRVAEIRGAVAGQFAGVSEILNDLSDEFKASMKCDLEAAEQIKSVLAESGFPCEECVCLTNSGGRVKVELEFSETQERIPKGLLMREVGKCCGRRFDLPVLSRAGGKIRAALCEMPMYDVEIGSDQHIANSGKLCGDCIDYFSDGFGKTHALICDGMGTGGRAAVDGNMAVSVMGRLLRSGLSASSSLQIVNTALMIKSDDESLSTVDLASVDLYSGTVELKKAGAAATYIRKGGRLICREMPSLPAGILNGIQFKTGTVKLNSGDMVVMVSDGVITGDEKWLEKLIKSWREGSTQELARAVVEEAIRRRAAGRDDDITAVAMRITDYGEDE